MQAPAAAFADGVAPTAAHRRSLLCRCCSCPCPPYHGAMEAAADALAELRQLPYAHRMAGVAACTLLQAAWLLRVASRASSPAARLLLTVPVLAANAIIPLLFQRDTEGVTVAFAGFMLAWCGWEGDEGVTTVGREAPRLLLNGIATMHGRWLDATDNKARPRLGTR